MIAKEKQEEEEKEKGDVFFDNSPYLYDMFIFDNDLESTSHTVEWLPNRHENKDDNRFNTEYFLMGTHEEDEEDGTPAENSIKICSINIPKLDKGVEFEESEKDLMKKNSKLSVYKSIEHPEDVSKARSAPGQSNIVASFSNSGDVLIFDFDKSSQVLKLKEHSNYGFGLCWQPVTNQSKANILITGGLD